MSLKPLAVLIWKDWRRIVISEVTLQRVDVHTNDVSHVVEVAHRAGIALKMAQFWPLGVVKA
jgi:hypothetical protein